MESYLAKLPKNYRDVSRMLSRVAPAKYLKGEKIDDTIPLPATIELLFNLATVSETQNYFTSNTSSYPLFSTSASREAKTNTVNQILISVNPRLYKKEILKPSIKFRSDFSEEIIGISAFFQKEFKYVLYGVITFIVGSISAFASIAYNSQLLALAILTLSSILIGVFLVKSSKREFKMAVDKCLEQGVIIERRNYRNPPELLFESKQIPLESIKHLVAKDVKNNNPNDIFKIADKAVDKLYKSKYAKQYYHNQIKNIVKNSNIKVKKEGGIIR